ncbi:Pimeloyl-ACP methyl ester carboxylesterase [Fontimonas thermophila]|uniref:Pimeloyl-ACP methyl ester carboxylesterase n=2 Tax=Fontimonas thermophila TaxID=1076937 RepID=A0A1I2JFU2_9GAMM|nr:Pimeloyl-ACP methyl ester carboxylesterase [Fontimonas thermophila]
MRRFIWGVLGLVVLAVAGLAVFDRIAPERSAALAADLERHAAHLQRKTVSIPGFDIVYLEGGSGEPLVLVHGFGADKDNFTRVAAHLTAHYRVIIPDLPGFGESSKPADVTYRIEDQAERLDQILGALGVSQAHFGGSSMGGWIIAAYAARFPDKAQSLWLLAPGGVSSAKPSPMLQTFAQTGKSPLVIDKPEDFAHLLDMAMADPPFLPYGVKKVLAERAVRDHALHSAIFLQLHGQSQPLQEIAPQVRAPSLIVWGAEDQVLDVSGAQILHDALPGSRLIIMPGIGHLPMLEAPRQTARDYLAFRKAL